MIAKFVYSVYRNGTSFISTENLTLKVTISQLCNMSSYSKVYIQELNLMITCKKSEFKIIGLQTLEETKFIYNIYNKIKNEPFVVWENFTKKYFLCNGEDDMKILEMPINLNRPCITDILCEALKNDGLDKQIYRMKFDCTELDTVFVVYNGEYYTKFSSKKFSFSQVIKKIKNSDIDVIWIKH